ncbi:MAG: lipopolysaccharide biosynthesis protein [Thermoguttaceae bacterium]|jgi:O-antigen/teichoic acid export membrane protein
MRAEECPPTGHPLSLDDPTAPGAVGPLRSDTLADSVLLLMAAMVLQRSIGFVREVFFCRQLTAEELGQWDMAFSFLMLAAPLAVVSLPGTFGRYVARYRQRGQLRQLVRRTAVFCAISAVLAALAVALARRQLSYLVFATPERAGLVALLAAGLPVVVALNYFVCLATALKNMRLVCGIEVLSSALFAVFALAFFCGGSATAGSMVVAYLAAYLVCVLLGLGWLARAWRGFPHCGDPAPQRELWSRLLPFAAWIMTINLLWNLFDVVGRYMIVHCWRGSPAEALAEVGNYRTARVLPLLLASLTAFVAAAALPHWSHDWEAGRRLRVSARVNLLLKVWAMLLSAGAAAVLLAAPLLFQWLLHGKFAGGFRVLPWTLTCAIWFGLTMIAQNYLWCAERAGLASLSALLGVAVNVGLSFLLLPRMGLLGAVLAAAAANGTALGLVLACSRRLGLKIHRGTVATLFLPLAVSLGPWIALATLAAFALEIAGSDRLFSHEEKQEILAGAAQYLRRLRSWLPPLAAAQKTGA